MATPKKKTNYIAKEIKKFETYIKQIQTYLDENPADNIIDRLDVRYSTNGNPIVKTIASKEAQLKAFSDQLDKLGKHIETLNNLRKIANNEDQAVSVKGEAEIPGFMQSKRNNKIEEESMVTNESFEEEKFDEDLDENITKQIAESAESLNGTDETIIEEGDDKDNQSFWFSQQEGQFEDEDD